MPLQLTGLVKRLVKGTPLDAQEGDNNWTLIQNFVNGLAQLLGQSVNPDGTLVAGALSTITQVSNVPKLADAFAASETLPAGVFAAGNYTVTNPNVTAYQAGMRVKFLAGSANTGATTVTFQTAVGSPLAIVNIFKGVNTALVAGDISINSVVDLIYDGTNFQMVGMVGVPAASADIITGTDNTRRVTSLGLAGVAFVSGQFVLQVARFGNVAHGLGKTPPFFRWVLVCNTADAEYAVNDEVPIEAFTARVSNGGVEFQAQAYVGAANVTNVWCSGNNLFGTGGYSGTYVAAKVTGTNTAITVGSWKAKCYASVI